MREWKNKKIIFFDGTLREGGAERVISILTREMAENNEPVEVVIYYNEEIFYELHPDVKVTSVSKNTNKTNIIFNLFWLRKYLKNNAYLVVSFLAPFNMLSIVARMGLKIPIIVADRSDPVFAPSSKWQRKMRDFLYRFADLIVLQTKKNESYFSKHVYRTKIISNPVNLGKLAGSALIKQHKKEIVSVGRLIPAKNHMLLVNAYNLVRLKHPEYSLVIYGEGEERNRLEDHIKELGIAKYVALPGTTKNVNELMSAAELFVLSSDYEGMPNALIEAMCLGLPVISTKVSGATDLIQHEKNGLLVECRDAKGLAEAMIRMIEDETLRKMCANNAVEINRVLNAKTITDQWMETIETTIKNRIR